MSLQLLKAGTSDALSFDPYDFRVFFLYSY